MADVAPVDSSLELDSVAHAILEDVKVFPIVKHYRLDVTIKLRKGEKMLYSAVVSSSLMPMTPMV